MAANTAVTPTVDDAGETVWIIPHPMYLRAVRIQIANRVPEAELIPCKMRGLNAVVADADMDPFWQLWEADCIEAKTSTEAAPSADVKPFVKLEPTPQASNHDIIDLRSPPAKIKDSSIVDTYTEVTLHVKQESPRSTIDSRSSLLLWALSIF